jgi:hypothetical protein
MGAGHKAASGEDQIAMAAASREKDAASNEIQTQEGYVLFQSSPTYRAELSGGAAKTAGSIRVRLSIFSHERYV